MAPRTTPGTSTGSPAAPAAARRGVVAAFEAPLAIGKYRHRRLDPPARRGHPARSACEADVRRRLALTLVALASSLDQAGPCARTVLDAALLHATIGGHDPLDSTSLDQPVPVSSAPRCAAT